VTFVTGCPIREGVRRPRDNSLRSNSSRSTDPPKTPRIGSITWREQETDKHMLGFAVASLCCAFDFDLHPRSKAAE